MRPAVRLLYGLRCTWAVIWLSYKILLAAIAIACFVTVALWCLAWALGYPLP